MCLLKIPVNSMRHALFIRLVFMYLVVILPIILLGVYLYNWSYKNASEEISRNTLAQMSSYLEDLNREVEWLEIQQFDMLQDAELNKIAVIWELMDNAEKKERMDYLLHRLTSIKNSSAYINDIYVHIRSIDKTISAGNGVHDFERERYNHIRTVSEQSGSRLVEQNDSLHLSASKFGGRKGDEPLFIVQIELNSEKLKESLVQLSVYPKSGSFLIAEMAGFTLSGNIQTENILDKYLNGMNHLKENSMLMKVEGRNYHIDKADSAQLGLSIVTYLPEATVKRPLNRFNYWAWLFVGTSLLAIIVYSFYTYKLVHRPLLLLVQSFRRMEGGSLDILIEHGQKDEFGYLYDRFNQMLIKLQSLIDQDFKQKLMMQKAELKQLQSQIKPHFLYNSFFILNSLAKTGDTERMEIFTNMLGEYFRFITRNGEENVWLSEEIKHARMYTEIQKLRFSRRISVQFDDLPKEMDRIRVPRLVVQPIIENAYEHSLENMAEEGFLHVSFEQQPLEWLIIVEDNGSSLEDAAIDSLILRLGNTDDEHEMTGMMNIHRRIMLTYGEGSGLFLSRSKLNGLRVEIRIKIKEGDLDA
ncbi:sensor histidine kinase [Paenibacillus endophyticus]|uniref:sensor histidine kinase n=1 Tax=Paenibacillus endophyticus TaxID=1294268 RepID=UPI001620C605|nr:histidine kinase [Paenibacillus endophyticus]